MPNHLISVCICVVTDGSCSAHWLFVYLFISISLCSRWCRRKWNIYIRHRYLLSHGLICVDPRSKGLLMTRVKTIFFTILFDVFWHHTHTFNGPFSGTTRVSWYQKGKTNLDFTGARDSEWQWHQLGRMQVCTSLQTDNHASTPPLSFLQAGCPSCRPTNSVKALKAQALKAHTHHHTHMFIV